jgi:hypothetical protein
MKVKRIYMGDVEQKALNACQRKLGSYVTIQLDHHGDERLVFGDGSTSPSLDQLETAKGDPGEALVFLRRNGVAVSAKAERIYA